MAWQFDSFISHSLRTAQELERRKKKQKKTLFQLKRVPAEIRVGDISLGGSEPQLVPARLFSGDFYATAIHLFTPDALPVEEIVSVTLAHPNRFFVRGRIVWSKPFNLLHPVISDVLYSYRTGIQLLFGSPRDREEVRAFSRLFKRELLEVPRR